MNTHPSVRAPNAGTARIAGALLGIWLFISAFAWRHSPEQHVNTWICGLLALGVAMMAAFVRSARYLNAALAVWLLISAFALPTSSVTAATTWNNAIVAVLLFATSLFGGRGRLGEPGVRAHA